MDEVGELVVLIVVVVVVVLDMSEERGREKEVGRKVGGIKGGKAFVFESFCPFEWIVKSCRDNVLFGSEGVAKQRKYSHGESMA
jgi:hypothetical protein